MPEQSVTEKMIPNISIGIVKGKKVLLRAWVGTPLLTLPFSTPSSISSNGPKGSEIQGEGGPVPSWGATILSLIPSRLRTYYSLKTLIVQLPKLNFTIVYSGTAQLSIVFGYEVTFRVNGISYGSEYFTRSFSIQGTGEEKGFQNQIKEAYQSLQFLQGTPIPPNASIEVEVNAFREIEDSSSRVAEDTVSSSVMASPLGSQLGVTMTYDQDSIKR